MSARPDYYRILHVQRDAPLAIIHASYRTLLERARRTANAAALIAQLDKAYSVLGDATRRADYDAAELLAANSPSPEHAERHPRAALLCLFCGEPYAFKHALGPDDECSRCASPVYPAERHRLEYSGRRVLARIPKRCSVEVRVTWPQQMPFVGTTRNLSLNGTLLAVPMRLQQDQIVRLDCAELRALGRVAHAQHDAPRDDHWLTGIEFLTLRFWQIRGTFVATKV